MKNDLGLSKGLLSSVSSLLNNSSKQRAEESKVESEKLAAYSKVASLRPLSMDDAKVASYAAKAPERRVNDTITQLYTQSVAEHNAKQKAEAEAIKTAYGKMGAAAPIAEAKELSPKQKKLAAVAGDKNAIDAMDLHVLRNRKKAQAGSVSDEKILDGESIDELNKETLGSYVAKATDSAADNAISLGYKAGRRQGGSEHVDKLAKRIAGIKKAAGKMVKEEAVEESASIIPGKGTTPGYNSGSYVKDIAKSVTKKAFNALTGGSDKDHLDRLKKNMYKEDVEQVEQIDEASTELPSSTHGSHSVKSKVIDNKEGYHKDNYVGMDTTIHKGTVQHKDDSKPTKFEVHNKPNGLHWQTKHSPEEKKAIAAHLTKHKYFNAKGFIGKDPANIHEDNEQHSFKNESRDTPGNSTHQCAIHVKHATMGEGRTLTSQHAEPDAEGQISWYAVMFEHGIEKVDTKDLDVLVSESHMNHMPKKKKK